MKILISVAFVLILGALASAGWFMLKRQNPTGSQQPIDPSARDRRMARALAARVGLSVAVFLLVLISYRMGWIQPTGMPVGR